MRGSSRASLAAATERVEPLLSGPDAARLGEELFAVARLLDSSAQLRRALSDPARDGQGKADLVGRLLGTQVAGVTLDVVQGMVRDRWSSAADLSDALEHLGVLAVVADAEQTGRLDTVEDELFRFGRVVDGDADLRRALDDRSVQAQAKRQVVERLLAGRAAPQTLTLVQQAVTAPRGRRLEAVLEEYSQIAADRRGRLVARVTAAVPLTEAQRLRLAGALTRIYGRPMHVDVDLDTEVIGGLRIQVGDEVIDATVLTRLDDARRRLAG
ncbi:F0F1 ATP synthase subunit delta [Thalassiella azotivora]